MIDIDELVAEFDVPDRAELIDVLDRAEMAFLEVVDGWGGFWSEQDAAALDKLRGSLWETVALLHHSGSSALAKQVAEFGREASQNPRRRRRRGEHDREHHAIRAIMFVLVDYWTGTLGREFKQNHKTWVLGRRGRSVPSKPPSLLFAFKVVDHIAPGEGWRLKAIAREFVRYDK